MPHFIPWILLLVLGACGEARDVDGEDPSLCSEARDPLGVACASDEPRIDSVDALAVLRAALPDSEIYAMQSWSYPLNVDGEDVKWSFKLRTASGQWQRVNVDATGELESEGVEPCDGAPLSPLDSRRAVHEAIARFDESVGTFTHQGGDLYLRQDVCGDEGRPEAHYVQLAIDEESELDPASYYARFRHEGSFLDFVGPCAPQQQLLSCLAGVAGERDE